MVGIKENMILQRRDIEMIKAIFSYRLLTRDQLRKLFGFGSITNINTRLRKLVSAGFLMRRTFPLAFVSSQNAYSIGSRSVELLTDAFGCDAKEIVGAIRRNNNIGEFFISHLTQINDVRISLSQCPDLRMIRWQYEPVIRLGEKAVLRPDAFFQTLCREGIFNFFLEFDNGTASVQRIVNTKIPAYLKMIECEAQRRIFGIDYFAVIIVVPNSRRLANIHSAISRRISGIFWLVEKERILSESFVASIFIKAGETQSSSVFGGD